MNFLSILFLASLPLGQIGGVSVYPGVVIYIHDIVLVFLLIHFCLIKKNQIVPNLTRPIYLFIAAAMVSLIAQIKVLAPEQLAVSSLYLIRWIAYAGLYVIVVKEWLWGLYIGGVVFGLLGLFQFFLYPDLRNLSYLGWDPHYYRLFSTFLDPNFAGIYLVLTFLLGTYLLPRKRRLIIIGECIVFVSMLFTYSRSSYLAFIAGLVILALLKKQWKIIVGIVAFVFVVIVFPKTPGSTLSLLRTESTYARIDNWKASITLIRSAPLFGHGFNTLRYVSSFGLDSSILFVGATTGLAGLFAYGYLLYSMVRLGRKHVWYVASFGALSVHSLFINSAFYPWVMIWMWVVTGVVERSNGGK